MITDNEHNDTYTIYSQSYICIVLRRVRILIFKVVANFRAPIEAKSGISQCTLYLASI